MGLKIKKKKIFWASTHLDTRNNMLYKVLFLSSKGFPLYLTRNISGVRNHGNFLYVLNVPVTNTKLSQSAHVGQKLMSGSLGHTYSQWSTLIIRQHTA